MSKKVLLNIPLLLALSLASSVTAQQNSPPPGQRSGRRGMGAPPVIGVVTSVGVDRFDIKKPDGTTQTVSVNDQTEYRQWLDQQQRAQEIHLEDLKADDHVAVRVGLHNEKQLVAMRVVRVSEQQFQRLQNGGGFGGGMGPGGGGPRVGGEITSISGNQIKVQSRRGGERVIVVNDQTTFNKEGKTITLKDLKVGDRIFALGQATNGQFIATEVRSGLPGGGPGGAQGPPQN